MKTRSERTLKTRTEASRALSVSELLTLCDQNAAVERIDQTVKLIDNLYTADATGSVFVQEVWIRLTTLMLVTQGNDTFTRMINALMRNQVGKQLASTELVDVH